MGFLKKLFHNKKKTAIVLGGGGVRGVAHLGVLKFLEENNYDFDFIVGTSSGAVFGALYLLNKNLDEAYMKLSESFQNLGKYKNLKDVISKKSSFLINIKKKLYMAKSMFQLSLIEEKPMEEFFLELFDKDIQFNDLRKELYAVATDLISGKDIVFNKGNLINALMASSSIPAVFPPKKYKNYYLIDGGTTQKLPSKVAYALGANKVIGIDVGSPFINKNKYSNSADLIIRSEEIVSHILHDQNRQACSLLLNPVFNQVNWCEFEKYQECFDAGYLEAEKHAKDIKKILKSKININKKKNINPQNQTFILE